MAYTSREKHLAAKAAWYQAHREEELAKGKVRYRAKRETRLATQAAYRAANLEKVRATARRSARKRYAKEPEIIRQRQHEWAQAHPEKIRQSNQQYYQANKAKESQRKRNYIKAHPEKLQMYGHTRRARKHQAPINDLSAAQWDEIKAAYGYRCVYCGRKMKRLTQDHLTPLSKQGSHTVVNVVPACASCNSKKHARAPLKPVQPLMFTLAPPRQPKKNL